jgi:hypothetical protein
MMDVKAGVSLPPIYRTTANLTTIVAETMKFPVFYTDHKGDLTGMSTWIDKESGKLRSDEIWDLNQSGPLVDIGRSECRAKHEILLNTLGSKFDAVITSEFVRSKDTASEVAGLGQKQHEYGGSNFSDPDGITHIVLEVSNLVGRLSLSVFPLK